MIEARNLRKSFGDIPEEAHTNLRVLVFVLTLVGMLLVFCRRGSGRSGFSCRVICERPLSVSI